MRKFVSWLVICLLALGSVGGVLATEITANCYTKMDGEILPTGTTDASNYTYMNYSNKKAPSIKNETNTVTLDSDAIYNDYGINTSSKTWRIDTRLNKTSAEVNKSMNLSKYINSSNYDAWKAEELANPNVKANDTLFVDPRPEDREDGYYVEHSYYDIFPYVIKMQAGNSIHIDCIKVLVVFYTFVAHPTPEPQPVVDNNTTNTTNGTNVTNVTNVTNDSADVDVDVVDNSTLVNGTVVPAVANDSVIPVSSTEVADEDNNPRSINLADFKTGSSLGLLVFSLIVILVCAYCYNKRR